jgi:putative transposase
MRERQQMIEPAHAKLSVRRQCEALGISRSGWYSGRDRQPSRRNLELMKTIDRIYTEWPWYGSRRIRAVLLRDGQRVNRKRIQRLMRAMGIAGVAPRRSCSRPTPGHAVYPYLLRNVTVNRPNQAWCADITYLPLPQGFMYLVAVMDWYSRRVLSWRLSNSLSADFCVEALQEALDRHGRPEIFNTDQGGQFTCDAFLDPLRQAEVRISMDGRGRWMDNVFVERLWRTVKHEDVYLRCYENPRQLRQGIDRFFHYYNEQRPHQALGYQTPGEVYRAGKEWNPDIGRSPFHPDAPTNRQRSILASGGSPPGEGPDGPQETRTIQP